MKLFTIALALILALVAPARAVSSTSAALLASKRAALAFNPTEDVSGFTNFSVQVDFADAAPAAVSKTMNRVSTDDTIYIPAHNLPVGLGVVLSTGHNYIPTGLTFGTTYFVIAYSDDYIKLAASANDASAGTAVDITAVPSVSSATLTLTPQALSSSATDGIVYQGSNDGSTFYNLSQSSVPYDASTTGALTSFTDYNAKYLRLKFTGPTTGALSITATINGRK